MMTLPKLLLTVAPLAFILGCSNPADNVPAASVTATPEGKSAEGGVKPDETPVAESRYFAFGPNGSSIGFIGSKVTGSHDGGFTNFVGEVTVVGDQIAKTGVKVVMDTTSLWSDNGRLTGHLKNADFFDVEKYPTAMFVSSAVEQQGASTMVTGELTLHGITKQISFPAVVQVSEGGVEVTSEFSLNRFDFEMKYPGKADDLIRKEVVLKLNVKASPGRADFNSVGKPATTAALSR